MNATVLLLISISWASGPPFHSVLPYTSMEACKKMAQGLRDAAEARNKRFAPPGQIFITDDCVPAAK